jgi:hypothetical protein
MTKPRLVTSLAAILGMLGTGAAFAQPNATPGIDLSTSGIGTPTVILRQGAFPSGVNAFSASTTVCNPGSVQVPFQAVMDPDHPIIAFLLARESGGRLVQISDRSFVKHAFGSANTNGCGSCQNPGTGSLIGLGCDDTYGSSTNANHFWLGPASEIDPWLGTWDPVCSHFDRGEPAVAPPSDCDGVRSLSSSQSTALNAGVNHRIRVLDADLNVPGSTFWYQVYYVIEQEPEAARGNNFSSRQFIPTWNGSSWSISAPSTLYPGTVLGRWTGATVTSNTNGLDDGRVYVAVRVTGPVAGLYHYEFAVHNRDNAREISALRIPACPEARVLAAGFHDVDSDGANDWTFAKAGSEIVWSTATSPLGWNTFFNFWFDSDAAPVTNSTLVLDEFLAGPGAATVGVTSTAPLGLYNVHLGDGCGTPAAPTLYATGSPARATLGNATFALASSGNAPGATVMLFGGPIDGTQSLAPGCDLFMGGSPPNPVFFFGYATASASGVATRSAPVPNDPTLEGAHLNFQTFEIQLGTGAYLGTLDASNGLRVRIGNLLSNCP